MVTVAPGIIAPDGSEMCPRKVAVATGATVVAVTAVGAVGAAGTGCCAVAAPVSANARAIE
jgi:hypothetical protein